MSLSTSELERVIQSTGMPKHWLDRQHEDFTENVELELEMDLLRVRNGESWATDDVSGAALDPDMVKEARTKELGYFNRMRVYDKVPRSQSRGHTNLSRRSELTSTRATARCQTTNRVLLRWSSMSMWIHHSLQPHRLSKLFGTLYIVQPPGGKESNTV